MMSLMSNHHEILYQIQHFDWELIEYGNSLGQITMVIRHHSMNHIKPCEKIQKIEVAIILLKLEVILMIV